MYIAGGVTLAAAAIGGGIAYYYRNERQKELKYLQVQKTLSEKKRRPKVKKSVRFNQVVSDNIQSEADQLVNDEQILVPESIDSDNTANTHEVITPPAGMLSKDTLLAVFGDLCLTAENLIKTLNEMEQQLRQRAAQTSQMIPEQQLNQELAQSFHMNFNKAQKDTLKRFGLEEASLQSAVEFYKGESDVVLIVKRFKDISSKYGPPPKLPEVPVSLTIDTLIQILEETMHKANDALVSVSKDVRTDNPHASREGILQVVQQRTADQIKEIEAKIHAKYGYARELIQAAVVKFQTDEKFLKRLQEITQEQQEFLKTNGM